MGSIVILHRSLELLIRESYQGLGLKKNVEQYQENVSISRSYCEPKRFHRLDHRNQNS